MTWALTNWKLVVVGLAIALTGFFSYRAGGDRVQQRWDHQIAADKTAALAAAQENQRIAGRWNTNLLGAMNAAKKREAALAADLGRAADERGRLLDAIQRTTGGAVPRGPGKAGAQPSNPLADVLRSCTSELQEMARAADGHANDVQTLSDAWPQQNPTKASP